MGGTDPLKALLKEGRPTIYLNKERVQDLYDQLYQGIVELVTTKKMSGEITAGFKFLVELGGTAGGGKETTIKKDISSPVIQAILLEYNARERGLLLDLSSNIQARPEHILKYEGESYLTLPNKSLSYREAGLRPDVAARIEGERTAEAEMIRAFSGGEPPRTAVWTATSREKTLACIPSAPYFNLTVRYYGSLRRSGLLGMLAGYMDDIVLIMPFWIWGIPRW
jgi:hypothetical protein